MAEDEHYVSDKPKTKKKNWFLRHKILTGILVLIVIIIAASSSSSSKPGQSNSSASAPTNNNSQSTTSSKPKEAKIGDASRDGKFEFTVNSVKCGETKVGSQYLNRTAQGVFCRINLNVKNIGNEAQTLDSTSQYAYNVSGQKYSTDSQAAIYAASDTNSSSSSAWYDDINPGNTVKGDLFFDVPKGTTLVKLELHDSALSNGVNVSLQ